MLVKLVFLVSVVTCVAAAGNEWAWKNVAEPLCNNCKCYHKAPQLELKPLRSLFVKKRYLLMANKLNLVHLHIGFGNRGMIKTDQDLYTFAPFTYKTYLRKDMRRLYTNWTMDATFGGSIVSRIRGNVFGSKVETGTSRKIQNIEDSIMGDLFFNFKVIWADKRNILLAKCFGSEGYSGWALSSTSRTLSRKTKQIVLEKISALGFKPSLAVVLPLWISLHSSGIARELDKLSS